MDLTQQADEKEKGARPDGLLDGTKQSNGWAGLQKTPCILRTQGLQTTFWILRERSRPHNAGDSTKTGYVITEKWKLRRAAGWIWRTRHS